YPQPAPTQTPPLPYTTLFRSGVGTVAESHGGFVLTSHVTTGDAGTSGGSFELRVPQKELQATIADLSKLGELRARSENGQDMTRSEEHTSELQSRVDLVCRLL